MIRAVALLHQHQREQKRAVYQGREVPYIEVTAGDVTIANRLADHVFGRSLDELPPHTRRVLALLDEMVAKGSAEQGIERAEYRFARRDALTYTGLSLSQLKVHLARLVDLERLLVHRGRRGELYRYGLLDDAWPEAPVPSGLTDPPNLAGLGGPWPGGGRSAEIEGSASGSAPLPGTWPVAVGEDGRASREEVRRTDERVEGVGAP